MVQKGLINPDELKLALRQQKQEGKPLGTVLLQLNMLSKTDLYGTLAQQWSIRCLAASATLVIGLSSFGLTAKNARAGNMKDVPAQLSLTSQANTAFTSISTYPALYGTNEKRSRNIKPFTKWTSMFARLDVAIQQSSNEPVIQNWKNEIAGYQGMPLDEMAERVNSYINKTSYITDSRNWGQTDYWATPVEFFKRGGDCEDYAIAKYMSLRALGVPEERLRIAIVQDLQKNIPHAVLIVYTDKGTMVLDNQTQKPLWAGSMVNRYKPIFSINQQAWWLHSKPESTVVASIN